MKILLKSAMAAVLPALLALPASAQQSTHPCGLDLLHQHLRAANPDFDAQLAQNVKSLGERAAVPENVQQKTTATKYRIQVVFHFVLDSAQVRQLGGVAGIQTRINSQMQQLNADWNAKNADSAKTPAAFKPLRGNMGVEFVLAKRDPAGKTTPGYEIVYTKRSSYDIQDNSAGSSVAYSDAKYASSGGAAAWDPQRYYNVWVLNMLPAGVLGIATPPRRPPFDLFPEAEQGTCVLYGAFGRKSGAGEYYAYPQATMGRTLTHETGHFLNLFHTWGSDSTCNDDDGIGDTPLQATSTPNNSPAFPVLDACTKTGSGIMFMNFMDYAIDSAQSLFTKAQAAASHADLDAGGLRNSLVVAATTSVPEWAGGSTGMQLFPNPTKGNTKLLMKAPLSGNIHLSDMMGRTVATMAIRNETQAELDLAVVPSGVYQLRITDERGVVIASLRLVKE